MSQTKIWAVTLPTAIVLLALFQNCTGGSFDAKAVYNNSSFGSTAAAPDPNAAGGSEGNTVGSILPPGPGAPPPPNSDINRRTLKVCPSGCPFKLPSEAMLRALDGDIVDVQAGTYDDCIIINRDDIKLRGVGGRAHLTGKVCEGKGEINITGARTVIENFEFSGMQNPDTNGSGIRFQGVNLTVRNSYFHDGEEGILTNGNPFNYTDNVLVENSKFERLGGGGGFSHAVYFGDHKQVTIKNSLFLSSKDQGHEFKSRAQNNTVTCSIFASLDGVDSYTMNFPDGGNVDISKTLLEQGNASSNSAILDYGSEMGNPTKWGTNKLVFSASTVINDRGAGTFFQVANASQFDIKDSVLVGAGDLFNKQATAPFNTTQWPDRITATMKAYPDLPSPASDCGTIGLLN